MGFLYYVVVVEKFTHLIMVFCIIMAIMMLFLFLFLIEANENC